MRSRTTASTTATATVPDAAEAPGRPAPRVTGQLAVLAFDIGAPIGFYYLLHAAGVPNLAALSITAVLPALSASYELVVKRRVNPVALVVLATVAVSIIGSLIAHNPRFLLAKDGFMTGLWGCWFFATLGARKPAAFIFARPLMEGRKAFGTLSWEALWDSEARFRKIWRTSTVIWGGALLTDAALRIAMAYSLPIDAVPALGGALWPVTFVAIQLVTNVYYHRAGLYRILGARWINPA